ncbi:hypothetical protein AB0A84_04990 [Streptomyces albidoflavus]|uniref:hypothetical protein n=1 Tax=Streptomyces albidoflavus TaxID=1886 RepID=UPI0033D31A28
MASGARQRTAEALTETGRDDRETALLVLELAVGWAAGALGDGAPGAGDDGPRPWWCCRPWTTR